MLSGALTLFLVLQGTFWVCCDDFGCLVCSLLLLDAVLVPPVSDAHLVLSGSISGLFDALGCFPVDQLS